MKNLLTYSILLMVLAVAVFAQAPPAPVPQTPFSETSISFNLNPVTLPGGHSTLAAAESDIMWRVTTNNHVGPTTLIGSQGLTFIGGRYEHVFPSVSNWVQEHTTFNGASFEAGVTASLGAVRSQNGPAGGYWGQRAGVYLKYAMSGNVAMAAEFQWNNFPGWQHNVPSVAFGPVFHF